MAENFIAEAFSLLAIGLIVIGFRLYSRILTVGFRRLAADDYLMIVAGVSLTHIQPSHVLASPVLTVRNSAFTARKLLPLMSSGPTGKVLPTTV